MLKKWKKKRRKLLAIALATGVIVSGVNLDLTFASNANGNKTVVTQQSVSQQQVPQLVDAASINAVIAAMTVTEKAAMVVGANSVALDPVNGEIIGTQSRKVPGAAGQTQAIPRLGIPSIVLADGPMGVRINPTREGTDQTFYATKFPSPNVLASSWDTELVNKVGVATAAELKAYGIDLLLAPGMNIQSYLLNGRNYEYFSEDPLVTGTMTAEFVNGVEDNGVGTTIKHFAAYNQRTNNNGNMIISQRALREIYLKGFEIAVKESQPWAIMDSYNMINGTYATENKDLLTSVLREDWGFKGFAMTDWEFGARDIVKQIEAGTNLLMPGSLNQVNRIIAAVNDGSLDEKYLDRNIKEILNVVIETPTFKGHVATNTPDLEAGAKIARQAAADGMVLLKNEEKALPIAESVSVSLFGTPTIETMTGGRGSALVYAPYQIGIPEGLKDAGLTINEELLSKYETYVDELRASDEYKQTPGNFFVSTFPTLPEMDVTQDAIAAAESTDVGIIVLSSEFGTYGSDRSKEDFYLSESKLKMIDDVSKAYRAQGKPVIAVLNVEGPLETASWEDKVDGIVLSWQPGQELGNAVADILTGKVNPSGKLPQTFPVDYEELPYADRYPGENNEFTYEEDIYVGYRYNSTFGLKPAYEFGYGLSYTTFDYDNVRVNRNGSFKDKITVFATVENSGDITGREAVQVYVSAPDGKLEKPELELKAFTKTKELKPGKKENLKFELDLKELASFDEEKSAWVVEKGTYEVLVGASSEDIRGTTSFKVDKDILVETVNDVLEPQVEINTLSKFN
ncbi:glycoside hydrolase family 3 N-terminal domain-containing protein [Litchfieldia salsa]|uniref:Beta-glucosidase n=1 Tax=Litchfieldia salsa TaxID=930152 RepID=A0A1H0PZR9_9BACI|nr:glycoside hydrolase family 3 N-terminal domain-containing protein [Litchfieldia salsa]SDP10687.1 beta-glucosidase [Litchfieldia salsa]